MVDSKKVEQQMQAETMYTPWSGRGLAGDREQANELIRWARVALREWYLRNVPAVKWSPLIQSIGTTVSGVIAYNEDCGGLYGPPYISLRAADGLPGTGPREHAVDSYSWRLANSPRKRFECAVDAIICAAKHVVSEARRVYPSIQFDEPQLTVHNDVKDVIGIRFEMRAYYVDCAANLNITAGDGGLTESTSPNAEKINALIEQVVDASVRHGRIFPSDRNKLADACRNHEQLLKLCFHMADPKRVVTPGSCNGLPREGVAALAAMCNVQPGKINQPDAAAQKNRAAESLAAKPPPLRPPKVAWLTGPRWEGKEFVECSSCRVKPVTLILCADCLRVRSAGPPKPPTRGRILWKKLCSVPYAFIFFGSLYASIGVFSAACGVCALIQAVGGEEVIVNLIVGIIAITWGVVPVVIVGSDIRDDIVERRSAKKRSKP